MDKNNDPTATTGSDEEPSILVEPSQNNETVTEDHPLWPSVDKNEPWQQVKKTMGWKWKAGRHELEDYIWYRDIAKPPKKGAQKFTHYVNTTHEMQYCAVKYCGWAGDEEFWRNEKEEQTAEEHERLLRGDGESEIVEKPNKRATRNANKKSQPTNSDEVQGGKVPDRSLAKPSLGVTTSSDEDGRPDEQTVPPLISPDSLSETTQSPKKKSPKKKRSSKRKGEKGASDRPEKQSKKKKMGDKENGRKAEKLWVQSWLKDALPKSRWCEIPHYVDRLVVSGFACKELCHYLTMEDLDFMPKAIRLAVWDARPLPERPAMEDLTQTSEDDVAVLEQGHDYKTIVEKWILAALPCISSVDLATYTTRLVDDGLYHGSFLADIEQDDLYFMKRGHMKRVMAHYKDA